MDIFLLLTLLFPLPALHGQESLAPEDSAPLVLAAAIEMPGVEGRIDHLALDAKRERLFVAALGNDSVEVLDLKQNRHLRSLRGPLEPQGILYLADSDRMVVACGESGACEVWDGETLEKLASVEVGPDADNLRYDPLAELVYVAYGEGALGIVDATSWKLVGKIELAGHPESFQLDPDARRAWVNVPDAKQVAVVDLVARAVASTWAVEEAHANFPMAIVPAGVTSAPGALVLLGCRSPAKLLLRSASDGQALGVLEISGDTDDIFFDPARRRVYVACGEGWVDVLGVDERRALRPLTRVATATGARTCLFVPERSQLFVAVPHRGDQRAEVRVFDVRD